MGSFQHDRGHETAVRRCLRGLRTHREAVFVLEGDSGSGAGGFFGEAGMPSTGMAQDCSSSTTAPCSLDELARQMLNLAWHRTHGRLKAVEPGQRTCSSFWSLVSSILALAGLRVAWLAFDGAKSSPFPTASGTPSLIGCSTVQLPPNICQWVRRTDASVPADSNAHSPGSYLPMPVVFKSETHCCCAWRAPVVYSAGSSCPLPGRPSAARPSSPTAAGRAPAWPALAPIHCQPLQGLRMRLALSLAAPATGVQAMLKL